MMAMLIPVACSTLSMFILGMMWFGPRMFGKKWLRYAFDGKEPPKDGMASIFTMSFIGYITAFTLQFVVLKNIIGISGITEAVKMTGYFIGMILGTQVAHYAFCQRPMGQYIIEIGYDVVLLLLSAIYIGYFG